MFEIMSHREVDEDGLPKVIHTYKPHMKGNADSRRAVLTVLSLYKTLIVRGDQPSLSSIIEPFQYPINRELQRPGGFIYNVCLHTGMDKIQSSIEAYRFKEVLEEMFPKRFTKNRLKRISQLKQLHCSSRNGPNGPAIATAPVDLLALQRCPELLDSIRKLAELTNHFELLDLLNGSYENQVTNDGGREPIHSRLSVKYEIGAKTRFFAIVDYFTQSVLKGFHNWIFDKLGTYQEDGTKSQDLICSEVKRWTSDPLLSSMGVYSTDLSKATDRLPATLQYEIVYQIAGEDFAREWYSTITQRDFHLPNSDKLVRFSCGQPLGAYSSWAMLAITHHVICRYALKRIGKARIEGQPTFAIVGDDNALLGRSFAGSYRKVMVDFCKVSVSPLKGFSPDTVSGKNPFGGGTSTSVAEFCKRVFYNGEEISTVSPMTLLSSLEYPLDFPMLISDLNKRSTQVTLKRLGTLASLNFHPDEAFKVISCPLVTALPSNILEGVELVAGDLKLLWFDPSVKEKIAPLYFGSLLKKISLSLNSFGEALKRFRSCFDKSVKVGSWSQSGELGSRVASLICDQVGYTTARLVDRVRTKDFDVDLIKQVTRGLMDLDDLRTSFFSKKRRPDDRIKLQSRQMARLIKSLHQLLIGEHDDSIDLYRYYQSEPDLASMKAALEYRDVAFIEVDDDWELVVPINFERPDGSPESPLDSMDDF